LESDNHAIAYTQDMLLYLLSQVHITGNVWAYDFKPARPLAWIAGQFIKIEVTHDNPDDIGTKRFFTIAAAPHEGVIRVATRLTDSTFKQALHGLPIGGSARLVDQPAGDFIWRDWPVPHVFVAQGIGITPFVAILTDRLHRGLSVPARLYFANRAGDAPYLTQLEAIAATHPEFSVHISTEPFTPSRLAETVPNLASATVYVSGPGSFFRLLGPPVSLPGGQLKQDIFPNYPASTY
jgi:ferredoxin-NADP reductase